MTIHAHFSFQKNYNNGEEDILKYNLLHITFSYV